MKLILVHGNFQDALLKKVSEIKKGFDSLSISEISGIQTFSFSSPSLFSQKRLIVLENPDIKMVEQSVAQNDPDLTILIKFSKNLEKTSPVLKKVLEVKGEILSFDETSETSIFPFLDMLGNKNPRSFIEFEKNYNEMGGQYLLTMLAYFLRRMVQKPKLGSDFMRQKIESQKKNFSLKKITNLYRDIIETDFRVKQGLIEEKLALTMLASKILG